MTHLLTKQIQTTCNLPLLQQHFLLTISVLQSTVESHIGE